MTRSPSRLWAAIVVTVALVSPLQHPSAQSPATTSVSALHDLGGVAALRSMFENDRDKTRIVLLLSPT